VTQFQLADGRLVHLIGDPHLGKNFDLNAPRHRQGERATRQMAHFHEELSTSADIIVMVGDLFDHPGVSHGVIMGAASAVGLMAEAWPDKTFVMMAGNHDISRNLSSVGAWTSFTKILQGRSPNLHILREPAYIDGIVFCPWEWGVPAIDQVRNAEDHVWGQVEAVVGHWDLKSYGGDDSHLVPTAQIARQWPDATLWSGHYHVPGDYNGVTCTGSMEPYSHGEDPNEVLYVTRSLSQLMGDPEQYRYKNVRVVLREGEEIPQGLDVLSLTHVRVREDDISQVTTSLGTFDWTTRLRARIAKLAEPVQSFIIERMPDAAPEKQRGSSDPPD
jgi:hypothetical protein